MIRVGCCGWPVARARYFGVFDLVELQDTFYDNNTPMFDDARRFLAIL